MPGLNIRFPTTLACPECASVVAQPNSYSTLRTPNGAIILFNDADPPTHFAALLHCPNGHKVDFPDDSWPEPWFMTPKDALEANGRITCVGATMQSGEQVNYVERDISPERKTPEETSD